MSGSGIAGRTDEDLVRAAVADPEGRVGRSAASELLGRYQRRVYLWCHRMVRDPERALELAQEVLTKAWRALPGFEGRSRFSSWIFVIARNRCLNEVASPALLRDDEVEPDALASRDPGPEERWEQERDEEAVRRLMMDHLDEQERAALGMRCFERLPVDTITRALGLEDASGARALLQRARRKLRRALDARDREVGS